MVERLDAHVVISSSWRHLFDLEKLRAALVLKGFARPDRIIGTTPRLGDSKEDWSGLGYRGDEVRAWLGRMLTPAPFVILDDMGLSSFEGLGTHLIQTDEYVGLTDDDCERAQDCITRQQQ